MTPEAKSPGPRRPRLRELHLYYLLVGCYFFSFGTQFVLFPSLVTFILGASPEGVGLAQTALSAPMFCLLLLGGIVAERAQPGPTIATLHLIFCFASLALASVVANQALTYLTLIAYGVCVGVSASFLQPIRDAALNGVIGREAELGRHTPLATAAATTTAVQIGAQIIGIVAARAAGASPASIIVLQAAVLALGAGIALSLRAPKPTGHERSIKSALRDVREGLAYAFGNSVISPMLISAAYAGVFIVGALQVLFPVIVRDAYGGDAQVQGMRLSSLLASFWAASFVSAFVLSRLAPLRRPGRALIVSHSLGALALASFAIHKPFDAFLAVAALWGLAAGVAISVSRTIVQGATKRQYLGRVLSVYAMGFMGGAPIGSAIVGFAAGAWGPRVATLIPAGGLVLATIAMAALTPLWRYKPERGAH